MKHWMTKDGTNLMLRGLCGDQIVFTNIKLGNGVPAEGANAMLNPLLSLEIASCTRSDNYVTLTCTFTNSALTVANFWATEMAVFAQDPEDESKEICYAIWTEEDLQKADYISAVEERILESQYDVIVFVGETENVTAVLSESMVYLSKKEFEDHLAAENPHNVTAEQVGLGNVENKTFNNQTPTFTEASTLANISSGEKMSGILGKIKKAISALIDHINATGNPHSGITPETIGAATTNHTHSAADLTSGTVAVSRGGTGKTSWTAKSLVYASTSTALSQISVPGTLSVLVQSTGAPYFKALSSLEFFSVGTTEPDNQNLLWIDTTATTGGLKYYNGSAWVHVPVAYTQE